MSWMEEGGGKTVCVHVHNENPMETRCSTMTMEGLANYWRTGPKALITQIKTLQRCLFDDEIAT